MFVAEFAGRLCRGMDYDSYLAAQRECDAFLDNDEIRVEPLSRSAHFLASGVWRLYRQQGGPRRRILSDFFIGSHAMTQANRLVSRDRGFYRKLFPSLSVIDPARSRPAAETEREQP